MAGENDNNGITLDDIDNALHSANIGDDNDVIQSDNAESLAEAEAGRKGWVPKDKYRGDPTKWKPASQFLADGEKFNKNLQSRLEKLERENEDLKKSGKAFAEYHEQQMQAKQNEIDTAIKQLRVQKSQATADGEHNLAVEIEDRIELLKEEKAGLTQQKQDENVRPPKGSQPPPDAVNSAVVREWVEDGNAWFDESPSLRQYAFDYANDLVNQTQARGRKFLDMVAEHMREEFPRQFAKLEQPKPNNRRADNVESSAGAGGNDRSGGKITIHDLPPEDLALMRDFVKKGWTTPEKFLAGYANNQSGRKTHRTKS